MKIIEDEKTHIVIPDSEKEIGESAFRGRTSLTSIVIPDSVTKIGGYAFQGCKGLTDIVIPDSVTEIGEWAFSGCTSLISIVIPESVTKIGGYAFCGCTSLASIIIPDSVTEIRFGTFHYCTNLTNLVLPESVTKKMEKYTNDELLLIYKNQNRKITHVDYPKSYAQYNGGEDDSKEECFITTAVCKTFGKPDDCPELTAFRTFRDTYMKEDEALNNEVNNYYEIAPKICAEIDAKGEAAARIEYERIWHTYLSKAYDALNNNEFKKAYQIYKDMVSKLQEIYL